ncbi:MAG: type II toxin-antitoxin system HigB family toxin [Saprospiraceae bacterium]|nr:type II toxin-antitoxin system HigB family toxin [Saprospiraceae bacterium]MBK7738214.1 type II toxin-antitoxin system HigB family toxin [Saprospiraceae bacterium]MBK7913211.1 type II toxin-antitoxin system HigB family toxin [Saprospiraceae bacterium]
MRIIARKTLKNFWTKYPDSEQALKSWFKEISAKSWKSLNELKKQYPTMSIVSNNKVVFNIKGNNYRLLVKINIEFQLTYIRFIGTHKQYDKIDVKKI